MDEKDLVKFWLKFIRELGLRQRLDWLGQNFRLETFWESKARVFFFTNSGPDLSLLITMAAPLSSPCFKITSGLQIFWESGTLDFRFSIEVRSPSLNNMLTFCQVHWPMIEAVLRCQASELEGPLPAFLHLIQSIHNQAARWVPMLKQKDSWDAKKPFDNVAISQWENSVEGVRLCFPGSWHQPALKVYTDILGDKVDFLPFLVNNLLVLQIICGILR